MDYETFGEHQKKETGIFDFLRHLPETIMKRTPFNFMTVSEVADNYQPVSLLHVPSPISWADEERDLTAWMGNELQTAAVNKLYSLSDRVGRSNNEQLIRDWVYLQSSDHFYYMSTKFFSDGAVHAYFNPYENPYQAFMNYMNVLSDFEIRLNALCPVDVHDEEINRLSADVKKRDQMISELQEELARLEKQLEAKTKPKAAATKTRSVATKAVTVKIAAEAKPAAPEAAAKKSTTKAGKAAPKSVKTAPEAAAKKSSKKSAAAKPVAARKRSGSK